MGCKVNFKEMHKESQLRMLICVITIVATTAIGSLSASSSSINAYLGNFAAPANTSTASPMEISSLDAPTEVAATGSERTITVSWQDVAGAINYIIAVRPANGTEPLE